MNSTTQNQDAQSVARVLNGAREEFRGLVERHFAAAYAAALARTGNAVDAEDVVQEAFLRAFTRLDTLRKPERFGAWVVQIARNLSASRRRGLGRELREDRTAPSADAGPEVTAARKEAEAIVSSTVMKLRRPDREVLLMHYYAGHTAREVAEALGVSRAAVLKRLERARKNLGDAFQEDKVDRAALRDLMVSASSTVMRNVLGATVAWQAARAALGTSVWAALGSLTPKASTVAACLVGMGFAAVVGWGYFARQGVEEAGAVTSVSPGTGPIAGAADDSDAPAQQSPPESIAPSVAPRAQLAQSAVDTGSPSGESSTAAAESEEPAYSDLNGKWDVVALIAGIEEEPLGRVQFIDNGVSLVVQPEYDEMFPFFDQVHISGRRVTLVVADPDATGTLHGEFNEALTELVLTGTIQTRTDSIPDAPSGSFTMDITVTARRVTDAVLDRQAAIEVLVESMKGIYSKLEAYGKANGSYPEKLEDLAPLYVTDPAAIESTDTRTITYVRPFLKSPRREQLAELSSGIAGETNPDNLVDVERQLIELWGDQFMKSIPILDLHDTEVDVRLWLRVGGQVREAPEETPPTADLPESLREMQSLAWNASCMNNMKQLGLVLKMFANEQAANLLPAGWRMVYREFLVDNRILTCPSHPDETESYELLFPASNAAYLHALARTVEGLGEDATDGVLASYVPIIIEKSECSDLDGRNVLFWDGHIERISEESWNADIGPYLAYR